MKSILKLSFIASLFFCSQLAFSQTEMAAEMSPEKVTEDNPEVPQIFKDYVWLKEMVDLEDCQGAKLSVRTNPKTSYHIYIILEKDGQKTMYNTSGKMHCMDHTTVNCQEHYKLAKELDSWTCK